MPRTSRKVSNTGVYHVVVRGVNKQQIFECDKDYEHFIKTLQHQCGDESSPRHCYIYAWCLMGNHVHLLMKEKDESIGDTMKRISSSYVYYYNHKYERVGHLFQERFKSQPVDSWEYFITLLRYIHQNPLKAHIIKDIKDYQWSSWHEYAIGKDSLTSVQTVLNRIPFTELSELVNQILSDDEDQEFLDIDVRYNKNILTDDDIWNIICENCGARNISEFQALPRPQQKHFMYLIHEMGVGPRTMSRITGIPYSIVQRATSNENQRYNNNGIVGEDFVRKLFASDKNIVYICGGYEKESDTGETC